MVSRRNLAQLAGVLLLLAAAAIGADLPERCAPVANPPDVTFTAVIPGGQRYFQQGEIIPLLLSLSSSAPAKYIAANRNYDRSGRLGSEEYCLEPDTTDPLGDYFKWGNWIGGGLGSSHQVSPDPFTMSFELNEWKQPPPGHYRLRVKTLRVSRPAGPGENAPGGRVAVPLESNVIEFDVRAADPPWVEEQLRIARAAMDAAGQDPGHSLDAKHAARTLRFLNTEASTRALARRFQGLDSQPFGWDLMFGLFSSPYREAALSELHKAIAAPDHPISGSFLGTLARLELAGEIQLPKYDPANPAPYQDASKALEQRQRDLLTAATKETLAHLRAKVGRARAITLDALVASPEAASDPALRDRLRNELVASWDDLPGYARKELIEYRWPVIAGRDMLPILHAMYESAPRTAGSELRAISLRRIYELDPVEGRLLILREMRQTTEAVGISVLGMLPDAALPEIEDPILTRMEQHNESSVDFDLIARYATARILPRIKQLYESEEGKWACAPQSAMLRYFLKFDPRYGVERLKRALAARQETGCYRALFEPLGPYLARPDVKAIAVGALDDPDPEVVRGAAEALRRYAASSAVSPPGNPH